MCRRAGLGEKNSRCFVQVQEVGGISLLWLFAVDFSLPFSCCNWCFIHELAMECNCSADLARSSPRSNERQAQGTA